VLLTFATCGSIGLLLGFWFRVPALVAASSVTVVLFSSVGPFIEPGPASATVITFAVVGVLQVGYLAGLMLSLRLVKGRRSCAQRDPASGAVGWSAPSNLLTSRTNSEGLTGFPSATSAVACPEWRRTQTQARS
jgi:hypothetical protein